MTFAASRSGSRPLSLRWGLAFSAAVIISACTQARDGTRPATGGADGASSDGSSDRATSPDVPTAPDAADAALRADAGSGADVADTRGADVPAPMDGAGPQDVRDALDSDADAGVSATLVLASGQNKPSGIALSATDVYWATQDGTILRCPKTGCGQNAPVVVASGQAAPIGLARSGSVLYWRTSAAPDGGTRAVMKCDNEPCGTGQPLGLSLGSAPVYAYQMGLAADSERVYASMIFSLASCPLSGCADAGTSTLVSGTQPPVPVGVAADATRLYLTRRRTPAVVAPGALSSCSSPACTNDTIIVPSTPFPFAVAQDGTDVYWSEYDFPNGSGEAAIRTCPLAGCDVTTARVVASGAIGPFAIALDDTYVYYTDYLNGRVVATPKHLTSAPCAANHLTACCGGVYRCDGTCTVALPANYGTSCSTCGGTIACDGTCSIPNCIAGGITLYPATAGTISPHAMTAGPDGNIWFTDGGDNQIGRIATDGTVTGFAIPTANSNPWGITTGPDGNLWFTEYQGPKIGKITPSGVITEFTSPLINFPTAIASAPDGALWFLGVTSVDRITTTGSVSDFVPDLGTTPDAGIFGNSSSMAVGADGRLWYPLQAGTIVRFETMPNASVGTAAGFALPTVAAQPGGITKGPDGNFWFTETNVDKIGRITSAGVITEFSLASAGSRPAGITAGADGNLWFAEQGRNGIGRITPAGVTTEYLLPPAGTGGSFALPTFMASAPDGSIWFMGSIGGIGRFHP